MCENTRARVQAKPFHKARRLLMGALYDFFKSFPYAAMELRQLSEDCGIPAKELNWNIVYLEKSGLVELAKSYAEPPFVSTTAVITAKGIELIEDEYQFNRLFPYDKQEKNDNDRS